MIVVFPNCSSRFSPIRLESRLPVLQSRIHLSFENIRTLVEALVNTFWNCLLLFSHSLILVHFDPTIFVVVVVIVVVFFIASVIINSHHPLLNFAFWHLDSRGKCPSYGSVCRSIPHLECAVASCHRKSECNLRVWRELC